MQHALKWDESIYAMDEVFGKEGTLGRGHDGEVVLTRYLGEMLMRLNPGLPQEAYQDALRLIVAIAPVRCCWQPIAIKTGWGEVDMETLLKGTCSKANLLDILENYILFDDSTGKLVKIVARNHQFLGVNRAIEAVKARKVNLGKLGVFWHTQGSGKSYSIVFSPARYIASWVAISVLWC